MPNFRNIIQNRILEELVYYFVALFNLRVSFAISARVRRLYFSCLRFRNNRWRIESRREAGNSWSWHDRRSVNNFIHNRARLLHNGEVNPIFVAVDESWMKSNLSLRFVFGASSRELSRFSRLSISTRLNIAISFLQLRNAIIELLCDFRSFISGNICVIDGLILITMFFARARKRERSFYLLNRIAFVFSF